MNPSTYHPHVQRRPPQESVWHPRLGWIPYETLQSQYQQPETQQQYQQPVQQQQYQYQQPAQPQQEMPKAESRYNAVQVDVNSYDEASKYPVNKDGDTIFFVDHSNQVLYCKWLDLGTGLWTLDIFEKAKPAIPDGIHTIKLEDKEEHQCHTAEKIDTLISEISTLRLTLEELKEDIHNGNIRSNQGDNKIRNKPTGTVGTSKTVRDIGPANTDETS